MKEGVCEENLGDMRWHVQGCFHTAFLATAISSASQSFDVAIEQKIKDPPKWLWIHSTSIGLETLRGCSDLCFVIFHQFELWSGIPRSCSLSCPGVQSLRVRLAWTLMALLGAQVFVANLTLQLLVFEPKIFAEFGLFCFAVSCSFLIGENRDWIRIFKTALCCQRYVVSLPPSPAFSRLNILTPGPNIMSLAQMWTTLALLMILSLPMVWPSIVRSSTSLGETVFAHVLRFVAVGKSSPLV